MKITGGVAKGQSIITPTSRQTRPSQNQVRLAIFSMLESRFLSGYTYDQLKVADLYAGTGALGIEALSRGTTHVDFVEQNKSNAGGIQQTIKKTKLPYNGRIYVQEVSLFLSYANESYYHLIFVDPPYNMFSEIDLSKISAALHPDGVIVYLYSKRDDLTTKVLPDGPLEEQKTKVYGATAVSLITHRPD